MQQLCVVLFNKYRTCGEGWGRGVYHGSGYSKRSHWMKISYFLFVAGVKIFIKSGIMGINYIIGANLQSRYFIEHKRCIHFDNMLRT